MREKLAAAIEGSKADYTEMRLEERETTEISFRGPDLEIASVVIDMGGIVRCLCRNRGWGIATFNSKQDLANQVERAYQCAQVAQRERPIELAPIPISEENCTIALAHDFRGISMAEKKKLAEEYNTLMLAYSSKIVDTRCSYHDTFSQIHFANSEGTYIREERPMITVRCMATARERNNVQTTVESRSGQRGFDFVQDQHKPIQAVAQRAVDLLAAPSVTGGRYPVIINQQLAGVFIHEAFGHLSESDFVCENAKAQEMMVLGRRFGPDILNAFDDGSLPGLRGSHRYDDEGTPTGRTDLIKDGILVGRLFSRETAAKMGERPTGNARATSYRSPPIVRMTNTAIEGGQTSFSEMIREVPLGIYACDARGGQTALETFGFSSAYAFMIRDGAIAEMVKDVTLCGNLFTTLMNIDAIGDDFTWIHADAECNKGQGGLPVSFGAPHVRIQDVVIGGR